MSFQCTSEVYNGTPRPARCTRPAKHDPVEGVFTQCFQHCRGARDERERALAVKHERELDELLQPRIMLEEAKRRIVELETELAEVRGKWGAE